jgi:iron complex outermembrane receptor protein
MKMKTARVRGILIMAALGSVTPVWAAGPLDEVVAISLAPQPLGDALRDLAKAARLQLLYDPKLVAGRMAPAVSGSLPPRAAFERLLAGTGLEAREESPGVVVIKPRDGGGAPARTEAAPASAAVPEAGGRGPELDEVVVTAQKRQQNLQDVPIAISAVTADDLSRRNVTDITDLRGQVPGLSIGGAAGANASNVFSIRGVPGLVQAIGSGQATAVYLDGVYLSRPDAAVFSLDDVERIEVLRGPQGALYGRNATAGAINIVTREPGAARTGGVDISYGTFGALRGRGSIAGPVSSNLSLGLSGSYEDRDGYFVNAVTGNRVGERDSRTLRAKAKFSSPESALTATLTGDWSEFSNPVIFKNAYAFPGTNIVGLGDPDRVSFDAASEAQAQQETRSKGAALILSYAWSDGLDLTSITSWRQFDAYGVNDNDGTAAPVILSASTNRSETFSQEIRGLLVRDRLRLTVGANYFREEGRVAFHTGPPTAPISLTNPIDETTLDAWALFGQMEYSLSDALTIVAGLRFNKERRDFSIDYTRKPAPAGVFTRGRVEDDVVIPSVGINFDLNEDVLLYAKAGRGYQAPGFNGFPGANITSVDTFDAETLWAYELGAKAQFMDRRLTVNTAAFLYDYKDLQVRSVTGPGTAAIDNAANAAVKGLEVSASARLLEGLTLSVQATYLDAKYEDFCELLSSSAIQGADPLCRPGFVDRSGNRLNLAPEWSAGASLDYRGAVGGNGELSFNLSYSMEETSYFSTVNESLVSTGGWSRIDARLGYTWGSGPEIYVYGRNLSDDRYGSYGARILPNLVVLTLNEPRTYGAGLRYRF